MLLATHLYLIRSKSSIQSIKDSLGNIFTDSDVQTAALGFANTLAQSLGQVTGSIASIGASIADNLLGGISRYLEQNKDRIKDYLIQMFNIGSGDCDISWKFHKFHCRDLYLYFAVTQAETDRILYNRYFQ